MKLSTLQIYILRKCYEKRGQIPKKILFDFYHPSHKASDGKSKKKPSRDDQLNIITKSVDRLIKKELLVGFGRKTAYKWFVEKVRLTPKGRKITKELIKKRQAKLNF